MASAVIAPSILAGDYSRFGEEAKRAEQAGGDWLHVDVMDGHFVPNISFGPAVTAALRRSTGLPLDVHLMISRPDRYVNAFLEAGADRITVHIEAHHDMEKTLRQIRRARCKTGVAINPATDWARIEPYLGTVDLVLCMTVVPGFGGQSFMTSVLRKVRRLADHPVRKKNRYHLQVDGGIDAATAVVSAREGADAFVAGTSLFEARDMAKAITRMRKAIANAQP